MTEKKTEREDVARLLPKRKRDTHKGDYGRAAIVAGSAAYTGAAYLSTAACLRAGAGYTTLFTPKDLLPYYILKAPEALLLPLNDGGTVAFNEKNFQRLLGYDSIAYGMGMGVTEDVALGAKYLIKTYAGRLILDADALNALAAYEKKDFAKLFSEKKCDVVLTPHRKEFSRLTGKSVLEIEENPAALAAEFAREHTLTVLLKSAFSVISNGRDTVWNTTGCAGQAKGGSGDVLSGVLAGLCAQGLSAFDGARAGAYLTGKAAEFAVKRQGEYSLLASDIIESLGGAFLALYD